MTIAAASEQSPTEDAFAFGAVDSRVTYPSYKSFDEFIDTERLRSLDSYIKRRIRRHIALDNDLKFYTGPYTLREEIAGRPGSVAGTAVIRFVTAAVTGSFCVSLARPKSRILT